ncbi:uncharacterized protein CEXT_445881 [Caerostris extrusa]|uniref:Uncharacterized protein n=1 Tax=Caerostris extrusa TaxID=172846 RepID=A0AAV4USX6_CAEEX|nr:uncharacterized protein CEXT_445881 [Caerostris extrusa]
MGEAKAYNLKLGSPTGGALAGQASPPALSPNLPNIVKMEPRLPSPCSGDSYSPTKKTKMEDGTWIPSPSQMSIDSSVSPPPLNGHSPTSSSYDAYCSSKAQTIYGVSALPNRMKTWYLTVVSEYQFWYCSVPPYIRFIIFQEQLDPPYLFFFTFVEFSVVEFESVFSHREPRSFACGFQPVDIEDSFPFISAIDRPALSLSAGEHDLASSLKARFSAACSPDAQRGQKTCHSVLLNAL